MAKKLGPCPLCGSKAMWRSVPEESRVLCIRCHMAECEMEIWNRISAIAEAERRLREALERCRKWFRGETFEGLTSEKMATICEEALK